MSGPGNLGYTYDAADRITGINVTAGNQGTLAYDNGDQLTSYTIMNGSTQVQKYTYVFDANGNRSSRTDASSNAVNYGWDQGNRLISYGSSVTYAYNGDGLRMSKTVNSTPEAFTWNVAEGLPLILMDGSTALVSGPGGLPLEQIAGGSALYAHQDQLGSTVAMTDGAGVVQLTKAYDAYGNVVSSTGGAATPLEYAGQYVDSESGLYYLRARYYDPATGEFMSRDPMVATTRAPYAYVRDMPVNATDPSGLCLEDACVIEGSIIIGTAPEWGPVVVGGLMAAGAAVAGFVGAHIVHAATGRKYSQHAKDRMDEHGISQEDVDRTIEQGQSQPSYRGRRVYYDPDSDTSVVVAPDGTVVTSHPGKTKEWDSNQPQSSGCDPGGS